MTVRKCVAVCGTIAVALVAATVLTRHHEVARAPVTDTAVADLPVPVMTATPIPKKPASTPDAALGFHAQADGSFDVKRAHYAASVTSDGALHYRAKSEAEAAPTELEVRLNSVALGDTALYTRSEMKSPEKIQDGTVHISRADDLRESYAPREDGVEQLFTLTQLPDSTSGASDLEFRCDFKATGLIPIPPRANRNGGIQFCDASGRVAVRYGQIVVRDAAGKGIALEPRLDAAARTIHFAVPAAWLAGATLPVVVDPLVGLDFVVSPDNPNGVAPPTVVAGNNNYLIVWDDFTLGTTAPTLVCSVVTQSGIPSSPIVLSANTTAPRPYRFQRTEAAFDGANWLVIWAADGGTATGSAIHGAIVASGSGVTTPPAAGSILGNTEFLIADTTGTVEEDPLVTFNGTDFVVVWHSGPPGTPPATTTTTTSSSGAQIYFTRVSSGGIVATPVAITSLFAKPSQSAFFVAGQKPAGDTLLLYAENAETPSGIRGARIAQDGTVRDQGGFSLFKVNQKDSGFGVPIGVSFIGTDWQVLSSYDQTTDGAVFLSHVSTAGVVTQPTGVFAVMGLGPTGTNLDRFEPAFAGSTSWLFLRNEKVSASVYHILGKRVGFDGTDQDPIPFQIDTASQGILRSAVAAQAGSQFLVTWLDGRKGTPQPSDARNIAAAIVDSVIADANGPALNPNLVASPTTGSKPLAVSFDGSTSTGAFDSLQWSFGDGSTSTSPTVSHTYLNNGTYTAQLTLKKGAYQVSRTVTIFVGGSAGSAPVQVGVPVTSTDGIVPNLFINTMQFGLDFGTSRDDAVVITGTVDPEFVPASPTGTTCSITIGTVTHQFALDSKGSFTSDATQPTAIKFNVKPASGTFNFTATKDDLVSSLALFGAQNATISPAVLITVPVTVTINSLTATAYAQLQYTATLNTKGFGTYAFQKKGKPVSGSFVVSGFTAAEVLTTSHNYAIKGFLSLPNGAAVTPATSGTFAFLLGNYTLSIPANQMVAKGTSVKYTPPKVKGAKLVTGLKSFTLNSKSGAFAIQFVGIPSPGANSTGLPLSSGNSIVNVDLNFSVQFDLASGHIDAGRYIFITRANANAKSWKLRDFN